MSREDLQELIFSSTIWVPGINLGSSAKVLSPAEPSHWSDQKLLWGFQIKIILTIRVNVFLFDFLNGFQLLHFIRQRTFPGWSLFIGPVLSLRDNKFIIASRGS